MTASSLSHAVDCHAHIFPPAFALPPGPGNKPEPYQRVDRQDYLAILAEHSFTHGVLSQPSGYRHDNRAMLDAIAHGNGRIKGVVIVPYDITDSDLDTLERQGVIAHRFNLVDLDRTELMRPEVPWNSAAGEWQWRNSPASAGTPISRRRMSMPTHSSPRF